MPEPVGRSNPSPLGRSNPAPLERSVPAPMRVRGLELRFGERTYVMGIINVTPDSFSGDGLLHPSNGGTASVPSPPGASAEASAVAQAVRMVEDGADLLDIGGESTRPGHARVSDAEELARVVSVVRAVRDRLPDVPISIDTSKAAVAEAALEAGADIVNDVTAVTARAALAGVAAAHGAAYVVMHGRGRADYDDVVSDVLSDLRTALDAAEVAGCPRERLIVDPGIGFGKTAAHNLRLLRELRALHELDRPILLGTSRKSTIGAILDLPVEERLEGTLATTALGIAALVDIVRVHDVRANARAARVSDAIIRGGGPDPVR